MNPHPVDAPPVDAQHLDPQRIVIIGAGPGIGAAVARRFGRAGFAVTLVARREAPLARLAADLRAAGVAAETATADAGDLAGFRDALEAVAERTRPGVVVYNAGLVVADGVLDSTEAHLAEALAIDVIGAVTAAQVFTPAMRRAGTGTFLVTGGGPGLRPDPAHATLSLGKAALRSAVSLLHAELADDGVHAASVTVVGVVAPGTPLDPDRIAEAYWALHAEQLPGWTEDVVVDGR